jgi:ATP-binding cassette subfamily C protein
MIASSQPASLHRRSELQLALRSLRAPLVGIGLISAVINLLYLTGSFFMLEVYDRVLPSKSIPTLVVLAAIAAGLFVFQAVMEVLRGRLLARVGVALDERLNERFYAILLGLPLRGQGPADGLLPLRDLDQLRMFLSSAGPAAIFDMPWMLLYLGICFAFHFWIGMTALCGAVILVVLAVFTEVLSRKPSREASALGSRRYGLAESARRNAEVIRAMGMENAISGLWRDVNDRYMARQRETSDVAGGIGSASRMTRTLLQSAVLGVGAYLVIEQQSTAGIIIASSILTSRALAPVDLAIANWRGFISARQSWARLRELLRIFPSSGEQVALPAPQSEISIEGVSVAPPGAQAIAVSDVTFKLAAGQALGVIGPSASGKSTLVRALVGVWPTTRGKVRLDGAALDQWDPAKLGPHIGYLPQDIELFEGTVAENIARFEKDADPIGVIAAATEAGLHDMILRLPNGYNTQIGVAGTVLSAGQRQRIALARAMYQQPFLLVLDEPNSNLDHEGEVALGNAIAEVRKRGGIVIIVAHRPSMLGNVDQLLVLREGGRMQAYGPRDEVIASLRSPAPAAVAPFPKAV